MELFAAISGSALVNLVIWVLVAGLIFWVVTWGINAIGIPEPFRKIALAILVLIVVIILVNALLSLTGNSLIKF